MVLSIANINNSINQVFLCNINNFHTAVLFQIAIIILSKILNNSIRPREGTLTGTTLLSQSRPGSNHNEGVIQIT